MIIIISLLLLASLLPHLTFAVVNGTEAKPHSRPYTVSLQKNREHICGGFLISDQFVLTAAHCWDGKEILTVVVGAHDLRNSNSSDRIDVESYKPHPNYLFRPFRNDIMLLRLQEKLNNSVTVKWISLPKKGGDVGTDTVCSVAGWGGKMTNRLLTNHLMEANVSIINNTECSNRWGNLDYSASQMMCAHGHGGSCRFDSGGPLVCGNTAVGVTSFGYGKLCNSPEYPNVYTKISPYLEWIDNIATTENQTTVTPLHDPMSTPDTRHQSTFANFCLG